MPGLNGIGLLCKIMNHRTCKNIPVIMMSTLDSMGLVFTCLSKGSVDFLVKPIRKNELKNLWQHVWRRCHSSSGSGSVSGVQALTSPKSKSVDDSDNNTGSNDEDDNASIGLNLRDGSDNGSGTQSSWTKKTVEVTSPPPMSLWDQADPHDSTYAQVFQGIHPKSETPGNEQIAVTVVRECKDAKKNLDDTEMGKDLAIGVPINSHVQFESYPTEKVTTKLTGSEQDKVPKQGLNKGKEQPAEVAKKIDELNNQYIELQPEAADLIGSIANSSKIPQMEMNPAIAPVGSSKVSEVKDKTVATGKETPSLDLSLKRLRTSDGGNAPHDERNVVRRSDQSAFSRYSTAASATQVSTGCGGSCSVPPDHNRSDTVKREFIYTVASNPNTTPPNQGSSGSTGNGYITKNIFTKPVTLKDKSGSTSTTTCTLHHSAFHPVKHRHTYTAQQVIEEKVDDIAQAAAVGQSIGASRQVQVQHHHYHYHHHRHHVHSTQKPLESPPDDDLTLKNMEAMAQQCGSSNVFGGTLEANGNYSVNGSASGSNHGSYGQNGSSTGVNYGGMNMESDNGAAGKSVVGGGSGSGSGADQDRFAQREAALTKFRQKRKERCFEKKVRYQSRKQLAEQRPRVRGQFVRQGANEHTSRDTHS
ncbi:two-component response regulator-like PRR37 isoform X2 [Aristolochia californica]